jgi:hypothetical protein
MQEANEELIYSSSMADLLQESQITNAEHKPVLQALQQG